MALLFKGSADTARDWAEELRRHIPDLEIRMWPEAGDLAEIDIALMAAPPPGELLRYPNLKAFINLSVGVDALLSDPSVPRHLPLARTVDPSLVQQMTTYVIYGVLHYHRDFDIYATQQGEARWAPARARNNSACRVGIMGLGKLGTDAATALRGLGLTVAGWSRTPKAIDGIETFAGSDGLTPFLGRTDILCCILPLTPETQGLIGRELLAELPRGAALINIARGPLLREPDLLEALDTGQLRGAMLDVFEREPLPSESPLWHHPRVVVTPHIAGRATPTTAAPQVAENIRRAWAGLPLLNAVDPARGY